MSCPEHYSDAEKRRFHAGRRLATPKPGEGLVITGMSGRFPNSDTTAELYQNLMNKVDLCDDDERRWKHVNEEIPRFSGKMNKVERFDNGFFGIHSLHSNTTCPMNRLLLERTIEALFDAGINPDELKGTNTGVFIGSCYSESEKYHFYEGRVKNGHNMLGCSRGMLANRISYTLQLNGPTHSCDTACSSSSYALEFAYRSIREGRCDMAIVGGSNLCYDPYTTLQFSRLGVLNMNTGCRPFDDDASGYTRSEAIVVVILQKEKYSKRIYCHLVHSKSNVDGFKEMGISFPSPKDQQVLLENIYEESGIDPATVAFIEAHGTGTKVGDPVEVQAYDEVFCKNRKTPLLIGSSKGNIGHTEPVSGLCALVKVILAMDTGVIPPNIHYNKPKRDVPALIEGRIQVVTEPTKWPSQSLYAGVSSFGFGGANAHALLKRHEKEKVIKHDSLPRLVCFSGRIEASIAKFQDYLENNELDYEFIRLFHEVFAKNIENHLYRGYSVLLPNQEIERSMAFCGFTDKPLYLCIDSGYNYQTATLKELSKLEVFKASVQKVNKILKNNKINIDLTVEEPTNLLQKVLISVTAHLGIIDILKTLEIVPTFIRGTSMGDFTCAYANGSLSMEEVLLATHGVSKLLIDMKEATNINKDILGKLKSVLPNKPRKTNKIQYSKENIYGYATPEYFAFNILNPKLIAETQTAIERDSVVIGIDYVCKLHSKTKHIQFLREDTNLEQLLGNIGKLYEAGYQPQVHKLYPEIKFPVSRGTPSLASLVEWKHDKAFYVPIRHTRTFQQKNEKNVSFNVTAGDFTYLKGHVIDGRTLFPATGYLMTIFDFYSQLLGIHPDKMKVCFENVKYIRAANISNDSIELFLSLTLGGNFEICESNTTVVTGKISQIDHVPDNTKDTLDKDSNIPLMNHKDIYKEFRLRGYNYKGPFKAVQQIEGNKGLIEWNGNWTTFLDNMLQLSIMQTDTRHLMVPTGIDRMIIDFKKFTNYAETLEGDVKLVPVEADEKLKCVRTKFIEINGLQATAIARKRQIEQPVLECYKFIPNELSTTIEESMRINLQIILETKSVVDMRVVEFVKKQHPDIQPLSVHAVNVLADLPVVQPNIIINTDKEFELPTGITTTLPGTTFESNNLICICDNSLGTESLERIGKLLVDDGFVISIEDNSNITLVENYNIFTKHQVQDKSIYLLQKKKKKLKDPVVIDISDVENFNEWISRIKKSLKNENLVIYAQNNPLSGLLGFINCLRREVSNIHVSGFFIKDNAPKFDIHNEFYKTQYEIGLGINVYEDKHWGTYRHMLLVKNEMVKVNHYFANTQIRGDLSSLKWFEGKLKSGDPGVYENYYVAINFRDIMEGSGKLPLLSVNTTRMEGNYVQGLEFAGRDAKGQRIMGIVAMGGMANMTLCRIKWEIPAAWTMEDAATVPIVYSTVLYALDIVSNKKGKSILIHSGTGGIGQAAINVCTYYECEIFVTVGTEEKKAFLLQHFPSLKASNIGNSRDTSFVQMVLKQTNGRGVDIIINSLAEEKLHASVTCLAKGGHFLEIGKYDLINNNRLNLDLLQKGASYCAIMLDNIMNSRDYHDYVYNLMKDALDKGFIKPLIRIVYEKDQLQEAFRYMMTGKHIGKVLIKIREEEGKNLIVKPKRKPDLAVPRYYCESNMTYVVVGGLGGFGLELVDWLVLRGARHFVLTSRNGIKSGYQQFRINIWRSYGVKIIINLEDVATQEGCRKLLEQANNLAPVAGIYNLAVELKDALFENQTAEDFIASFRPKAYGTKYLDELTRKMCPQLKQFVVFSSVSCGRGNAGQTNYGMSNSIMERICEQRKLEGLPALAIQWGAVGDVGLVADMQKEATEIAIGGTLQQRISGCLEVMDRLLKQNEPVVSSVVVAEKYGSNSADNLADAVLNIIGLRDLKTVSLHTSLAELGMDSMMAVEIKQTLEQDFDVFLSPQDMRNLTFARLIQIGEGKLDCLAPEEADTDVWKDTFKQMIGNIYSAKTHNLAAIYTEGQNNSRKIVVFPGIEGSYLSVKSLCENLNYSSMCVQYKAKDNKSVESLVQAYWPLVKEYFSEVKEFIFIAHSYGSVLALEMAAMLEKDGYLGKIVFLDGSPNLMKTSFNTFLMTSKIAFEIGIITLLLSSVLPDQEIPAITQKLLTAEDFETRTKQALEFIPDNSTISKEILLEAGKNLYNLTFILRNFVPSSAKIGAEILLCVPTVKVLNDVSKDLDLSIHCSSPIQIATFKGTHLSFLENTEMFDHIKNFVEC